MTRPPFQEAARRGEVEKYPEQALSVASLLAILRQRAGGAETDRLSTWAVSLDRVDQLSKELSKGQHGSARPLLCLFGRGQQITV